MESLWLSYNRCQTRSTSSTRPSRLSISLSASPQSFPHLFLNMTIVSIIYSKCLIVRGGGVNEQGNILAKVLVASSFNLATIAPTEAFCSIIYVARLAVFAPPPVHYVQWLRDLSNFAPFGVRKQQLVRVISNEICRPNQYGFETWKGTVSN